MTLSATAAAGDWTDRPDLPQRYRDAEPLARGGMADVYRVHDPILGRAAALKILPTDQPVRTPRR
ncbi:MAG: hypothetical protein AAF772_19930, partial [Acidobacteriota bacterium]